MWHNTRHSEVLIDSAPTAVEARALNDGSRIKMIRLSCSKHCQGRALNSQSSHGDGSLERLGNIRVSLSFLVIRLAFVFQAPWYARYVAYEKWW